MIKKAVLISLILSFALVGAGYAQDIQLPNPGLLPGSPFYFFKNLSERLRTFLTFGNFAKAERFANLAEKRLSEAKALAEKGKAEAAEEAIARYQKNLLSSLKKAKEAKEKGKDVSRLLTRITERTSKHLKTLADVFEKVPQRAKETIRKAMEQSARRYGEAIQMIGGEKTRRGNESVPEMIIAPVSRNTVVYTNSGYTPRTLHIKAGDAVIFNNESLQRMWTASAIHPTHRNYPDSDIAKCDTPEARNIFDSCEGISTGESWSFTFTHAGNWKYHNHLRARHTGTIIVE